MKPTNPNSFLPENLKDIEQYMDYRRNVLQNDPATVRCRRHELNHLLQWAGTNLLTSAREIEPAFPIYLLTARRDGKDKPLSPKSLSKITEGARMFFEWARLEDPDRYGNIPKNWLKSIRPRRANGIQSEIKINLYWALEDMRKIAGLQLTNLADIRDQAAICFLYLTGMRVPAFVSMPIACVDLEHLRIEQLPSKGVKTKNHKAAVTSLLPIQDLLDVVKAWDEKIRTELPPSAPWYAKLTNSGMKKYTSGLIEDAGSEHGRREALIEGMRRLCSMALVEYLSPTNCDMVMLFMGSSTPRTWSSSRPSPKT